MWKLLPVILLALFVAIGQTAIAADEESTSSSRIVNTMDLTLKPSPKSGTDRMFEGTETQGSISATGVWNLSTGVSHNRLRCATYETGIQLGKGNPACTKVEWLTEADFGSSRRHCNSAVLIHKGSGKLTGSNNIFKDSTCVRIVTKCSGAC